MVDGRHSTMRAVKKGRATLAESSGLVSAAKKSTPREAKSRVSKQRAMWKSFANARTIKWRDAAVEIPSTAANTPTAGDDPKHEAATKIGPAIQAAIEPRPPAQDDLPLREEPFQPCKAPFVEPTVVAEPAVGENVEEKDCRKVSKFISEDCLTLGNFGVVRARVNDETESQTSKAPVTSEARQRTDSIMDEPVAQEAGEAEGQDVTESQQVPEYDSPLESDSCQASENAECGVEPPAGSSQPTPSTQAPPTRPSQLPGLHLANTPPPASFEVSIDETRAPPAALSGRAFTGNR